MKKEKVIFIFESIHQVLKAEKALDKAGESFDIIPVPKEINPECGMALEVDPKKKEQIHEVLKTANIKIRTIYNRQGSLFMEMKSWLGS